MENNNLKVENNHPKLGNNNPKIKKKGTRNSKNYNPKIEK